MPRIQVNLTSTGKLEFYRFFFTAEYSTDLYVLCSNLPMPRPYYTDRRNKRHYQQRASLWVGPTDYNYGRYVLPAISFRDPCLMVDGRYWLDDLRVKLEKFFGRRFNSCLFNYYESREDTVPWHADDESIFGESPFIVSVSFGGVRTFEVAEYVIGREIETQFSFNLNHGSVIVMSGDMQSFYKHRVPATVESVEPRFNLTFRYVV